MRGGGGGGGGRINYNLQTTWKSPKQLLLDASADLLNPDTRTRTPTFSELLKNQKTEAVKIIRPPPSEPPTLPEPSPPGDLLPE
ncbi:hypothetical protein CEXT_78311 [Caerostris extrusa]|uniref:Uncharacterized protein n=1 Tax=Caerostris extrusa TaxID=172846 RepID=A0AAV4RTJ0_CAEEX|nr:hypothetical protein CEXT_78311 [Caerostris extrusa]